MSDENTTKQKFSAANKLANMAGGPRLFQMLINKGYTQNLETGFLEKQGDVKPAVQPTNEKEI